MFVILYMLGTGKGFNVNYLFSHIFGGGLMLGAWFMATDYVPHRSHRRDSWYMDAALVS